MSLYSRILYLLQILSVTGYRYDYPVDVSPPVLSINLIASFTLNSTNTVHLQANTSFHVYQAADNLSISFVLEESTQSKFTLLFSNAVTTWQLSGASFSHLTNGTEVSEQRNQLLRELGDSLPIPLQHNHSYFCDVPFSHSSNSFLSSVQVSTIHFQIFPSSPQFSEPQVCFIAYNEFWLPTIVSLSLMLFLTIVVIINGIYHNLRKHGKKLLKRNTYVIIPLKDGDEDTTK